MGPVDFVFVYTRRSVSHISHECAGRCLPQSISCHEKESRRIDVNISDELLFVFVLHYVFVFSGRDVGCISHGGGGRSRLPWVGVEWNRGSTSVGTSTCRQQQWLLPFFTKNILTRLSMTFFCLKMSFLLKITLINIFAKNVTFENIDVRDALNYWK